MLKNSGQASCSQAELWVWIQECRRFVDYADTFLTREQVKADYHKITPWEASRGVSLHSGTRVARSLTTSELLLRVCFMFRFDWHCIQLPVQCYGEDTREQGDIFCKASGCQHGPFTGVCPLDHCTEHTSTHTARFPLLSQAGGWLLGPLDACSKERADKIQVLTTLWLNLATPIVLFSSQPRKTFGQLFCGSLDNYGILCVGLYRVMDEKKKNLEHKRGVCWLEKY